MNHNLSINLPESSCPARAGHPYEVIADSGFLLEDAMETWKDIKGWEGLFQISDHGRLKSFLKDPNGYIRSVKNGNGWYLTTTLTSGGRKMQTKRIHRLVAEAFIPNPDGKPTVNHKDLNKQNNHFENLEWAYYAENMGHAISHGVDFFSSMNHYNKFIKPKRVVQLGLDGTPMRVFWNCKDAGRKTGVCSRNIHQVAAKTEYRPGCTRSQAGGYKWSFIDEN